MRPPTLKPRAAGRGFAHALPVPSWTHDHIPTRTLRGETGGAGSQECPNPWTCARCGAVYVVPSLARMCEAKHG